MILSTFLFQITPESLEPIFKQFAYMLSDSNVDIVETVYDIILNPKLQSLIQTDSSLIFPILVPAIKATQNAHWDEIVRFNAVAVLQYLAEIDRSSLLKTEEMQKMKETKEIAQFGVQKTNWTRIAERARLTDSFLSFSDDEYESLRNLS